MYLQTIKLCQKKISDSETPHSSWFDKRNWIFFNNEIHQPVKWFNIPKELVINIDQTPLPFVLISSYTMEKKGNQCVPVAETTEYPLITGTFGVSLSRDFLPIQLIYQGETKFCQPTYPFSGEFDVTQTENHWANENISLDLIKEVLVPYVRKV